MKGDHLYGGTDMHGCFAIYFFNPCFRVLMAWDKYHQSQFTGPSRAVLSAEYKFPLYKEVEKLNGDSIAN